MKGSFIIFSESRELTAILNLEQKGMLLDALFAYDAGEDISGLDDVTMAVFISMRQKIDAMNEKYEETRRARSAAGRASGESRQRQKAETNKKEQTETKTNKDKQNEQSTNKTNLTEPVTVTESVSPCGDGMDNPPLSGRIISLKAGFEEAWKAYPRKQGRKGAQAAYESARKRGVSHKDIMTGIQGYADYVRKNRIEAQYVKMGDTFFRQNGWESDWGMYLGDKPPRMTREEIIQAYRESRGQPPDTDTVAVM